MLPRVRAREKSGHDRLAVMDIDPQQRRSAVALACKLAWADGVVTDEEREFVASLSRKLGLPVDPAELEAWLNGGGPEAALSDLPESLGRMFVYEAMRLMEADGEIDARELALVEGMVERLFASREEGSTLARIALEKRPVRR